MFCREQKNLYKSLCDSIFGDVSSDEEDEPIVGATMEKVQPVSQMTISLPKTKTPPANASPSDEGLEKIFYAVFLPRPLSPLPPSPRRKLCRKKTSGAQHINGKPSVKVQFNRSLFDSVCKTAVPSQTIPTQSTVKQTSKPMNSADINSDSSSSCDENNNSVQHHVNSSKDITEPKQHSEISLVNDATPSSAVKQPNDLVGLRKFPESKMLPKSAEIPQNKRPAVDTPNSMDSSLDEVVKRPRKDTSALNVRRHTPNCMPSQFSDNGDRERNR